MFRSKEPIKGTTSRPPLERMLQIHQYLLAGRHPNANVLAEALEVSAKSIHRDLEFMRDRFGLPLEYDYLKKGYRYTEKVESFPALQISEGELFALLVAEKALQQYRGTPFEKPLLSALKKMSATLPDTISLHLSDWEQSISFRTSAEPVLDLQIFESLAKATAEKQQLRIGYRKAGAVQGEQRVVDPYHLANINGEWFLFGYCHLRKDFRTFVPGRIIEASMTGKRVVPKPGFSLAKRLKDSFGMHSPEGTFDVVLKCDVSVADMIREKKWHQSQVLKNLPDGSVELRMRLSSLVEIQRWILTWAGKIKVLEPAALRQGMLEAAENLLQSAKA